MPPRDGPSLWSAMRAVGNLSGRFLAGSDRTVALSALADGWRQELRAEELRGRSVLIASADQLFAALALIELDGVARRLVLWPADLALEHIPYVVESAEVDAIVSDGTIPLASTSTLPSRDREGAVACTEWILLTSGTTGRPKMVVHTLSSLCGAIEEPRASEDAIVWSTFYDIRRYGGLQIFLRAMLTGGSLVLSSAQEPVADFLIRAGAHGVSHISGTPSHWRRALMSPAADKIAPRYVRLSGEIADQSILDNLRSFYPQASVAHAFASTEAGVAFDVRDGLEGFPANLIGRRPGEVEMKVEDGSLRIRSSRTAGRYIGYGRDLADANGFVDTGDLIELRGGRYYFVGRRDGTINIGGHKVHPEEVEGVINRHPQVQMSLVRPRKNPLLGALAVADIVLEAGSENEAEGNRKLENEILAMCREALPRHKVPATIKFVDELEVAASGKMVRHHA